jgi:hypothetical protein
MLVSCTLHYTAFNLTLNRRFDSKFRALGREMAAKGFLRAQAPSLLSILFLLTALNEEVVAVERNMRNTWLDINLNCGGLCYYFMDQDTVFARNQPGAPANLSDVTDPNRCAYYSYGSTVSPHFLHSGRISYPSVKVKVWKQLSPLCSIWIEIWHNAGNIIGNNLYWAKSR